MEASYFTILDWIGHTSTWIRHGCTHVSPPGPPPTSFPIPSVWVIPVHQPQASCILHWTWTVDSFLKWYYMCFNAILPNHTPLPLPQSPDCCYTSVSLLLSRIQGLFYLVFNLERYRHLLISMKDLFQDTKIYGCSNPWYKMAKSLHPIYVHLPVCINSSTE